MPPEPETPIGEDDLHAFVDGVLDPARLPAVRRYLAERPAEAARVRAFAAQRDALRAALAFKAEEPVPARLRLSSLRAARRTGVLARWRAAGAAAALVLGGIALGWTVRGTLQPEVTGSLPAPAATRFAEAPAAQADIAAWLADRLGEPMPVPDLSAFGFTPQIASVRHGEEGVTAMLRYTDGAGATVSLWRRPTADPVPRELRCADEPGGVVTYTWSNGRHLHAVSAALPRDRLRPIAHAVKRRTEAAPPSPSGLMAGSARRPCEAGLG